MPWDHLPDYVALAVEGVAELFGPGERKLAYLLGWAAHILGDSLIKPIRPGSGLHLLGGKYTPANRPIQDLVTFHEIGRRELGLDWADLLADLYETPVEPIQLHSMRAARPRGILAARFPDDWLPEQQGLLQTVLAHNRRYQQIRSPRLLQQYALTKDRTGWTCRAELSRQAGGLSYPQMLEWADQAGLRHALWQLGEAVVQLFQQVIERQPRLAKLPQTGPTWGELTRRYKGC